MTPKRRRNAFTIIEILVVVGIIAVLIGILLPALSGAQKRSRKNTELSFLRQVGMAWTMYANNYEDAAMPGFIEPAVQGRWALEWETTFRTTITDPLAAAPYPWRLMPFLDSNPEALQFHDADRELDLSQPEHVLHFARHPAFGYNGYYVGGWWREVTINGSIVAKAAFHDALDSEGRPANVVATRITQIRRPTEVLTFCSTTPIEQTGILRSRDTMLGSHIAHPPTIGEDVHWTTDFASGPGGGAMQQGFGSGSDYDPYAWSRTAAPLGRYTKLVAVVFADNHTETQTAGGLDDMRKWTSGAENATFTHTMGSLVSPGFTFHPNTPGP